MDNVPAIVPLLEREHRVAENRLGTSKKELDDLATDKLKVNWHMRNQRYACTAQHHAVGNALYPPPGLCNPTRPDRRLPPSVDSQHQPSVGELIQVGSRFSSAAICALMTHVHCFLLCRRRAACSVRPS